MKYRIIVDKQPRTNATSELKLYDIDIEELRFKGDICDTLVITKDEDYVIRRLSLNEYNVLSVLPEPVKEPLQDINIKLFEGDNYIYLMNMTGNKFYAEYLVKNDFTDMYVTINQMNSAINQTAKDIELNVNQKLGKDEFGSQLLLNSNSLKMAWNQISQYLKMEGIDGKASLNIYSKDNKILMSLSDTGQKFYKENGKEIGEIGLITYNNEWEEISRKFLAFSLNVENDSDGMAWGIKNSRGEFFPIFLMACFDYVEQGEYAGYIQMIGTLDMLQNEIKMLETRVSGIPGGGIYVCDANGNSYLSIMKDSFSICNNKIELNTNDNEISSLDFHQCNIKNVCYLYINSIIAESVSAGFIEQTSLKSEKKNIKKLNIDALELVKNADICSYNLKSEKKRSKKAYRTCNRRRL